MAVAGRSRRCRVRLWYARATLMVLLAVGVAQVDRYASPPGQEPRECPSEVRQVSADVGAVPAAAEPYPEFVAQRGGTVGDASCLTATPVWGVVRPLDESGVRRALAHAAEHHLAVSVAGTRHSMGGQASYPGALVLDMRGMDRVTLTGSGTVRVGAGTTWRTVLETLHAEGLSVAAMPSIDILSVGGTVSVNAHGADFRTGSLAATIRSLRLMTADGTVRVVAPGDELFAAVVGGYGLFGVILEVELVTVQNTMYDVAQRPVAVDRFAEVLTDEITPDDDVRMMFAHLSTSPGSLLEQAIVYTYRRTGTDEATAPALRDEQNSRVGRLALNLARHGGVWQRLRWAAQRDLLPRLRTCTESRNEALRAAEACLVSRNQAMYNGLGLLRHKLPQFTDVLQEYFLTPDQLAPFLAETAEALRAHDAQLLSASIRSVPAPVPQGQVLLGYAPDHRLSVVLYLSQTVDAAGNDDMRSLTEVLVTAALDRGATFYLPYQQHYTRAQLVAAYPRLDDFFAVKRAHDPDLRFMNSLYANYADPAQLPG